MAHRTRTTPTPARAGGPATPPGAGADRTAPAEEDVRARAYELWEQAGRPDGDGVSFWLQAEKELRATR